jgi:ribosomal protein S18 acetylase RimI-like enzyme
MAMNLRQGGLEPADRARIAALLASVEAFTPDERAVALELVDHRLAHSGSDDYRFVLARAPASEELAGYLCYGRTPLTLSTYDLYWIATSPSHARRGVGRALIEAMADEIAGAGGGLVRVETGSREGHVAAVRFYEATGFERAAVLAGFYAPGDDLLVFTKRVRDRQAPRHGR